MKNHSNRTGSALPFVIVGVVALGLVGVAAYYAISMQQDTETTEPQIFDTVSRGEFVSQVLDQGEVQSSENVEIRCEVRARNGSLSVIKVVPEGSRVTEGDFLVQLDSTSFEKELEQQNISLVNAETQVIQAQSSLDSAKATKDEYVKGTFEQEKLTIKNEIADAEAAIKTAEQQLKQANDTLGHSEKLQSKGFITAQALESADFELKRAKIELQRAKNSEELALKKMWVLEEITFDKNVVQFDADIKAATVKLDGDRKGLQVEKEKQAEIQEMIDNCRIEVPPGVSGQVVYAKESSRGGNDWILEEGTTVRQNQVLIRLPNPDKMEVKALINEQSITQIEENMPCTIKVDALNDITLKGRVTKVNQYAESSGWMSSSIRKYAVLVQILDPPPALKPGMNASVTIQVQFEEDVLTAPIQTIYAVQDKKYCLVKKGEQYVTCEVELGGDNSQTVLIRSGVEEGDTLVMNPGAHKSLMDLPEVQQEQRIELPEGTVDAPKPATAKKEGDAKPKAKKPMGTPTSGKEFIASKDTDGDGKLTKDEMGAPWNRFFDRIDSDGDGMMSQAEADKVIAMMKRGGGGGRPGAGGGGGGRPGAGGGGPR